MGTSSLADIRQRPRSSLFFGQYEFCVIAQMTEAFVLRHRTHALIDTVLAKRMEWGRRLMPQPGSWAWAKLEVSDEDIANLHTVLDWILRQGDSIKVTVSGDYIYVYTQDLALAQEVADLPGVNAPRISRAVLRGAPGVINLRQSDYQFRTYLRWASLTPAQKHNLKTMLNNQTDIRLGPGLSQWLENDGHMRIQDHYFVDHNDQGILTMLALTLGRVIRKTVPIQTY